MKYAIQMGSGAMIYIPGFTKTGSGNQELISLLLLFQHTESRLKMKKYIVVSSVA
jgi:hypothetical protein